MFNKLKLLGQYVYKNEGQSNPLQLNYSILGAYILLLDFNYTDSNCVYNGILTVKEYNKSNMNNFLYTVVPSPRSIPPFPSWTLSGGPSTALKKIKGSLINCNLENISDKIDELNEQMIDDIENNIDKSVQNLLSIRINEKFIRDSVYFSERFNEYKTDLDKRHYYMKSKGVTSKSDNALCYLCGGIDLVYGFVNLTDFTFYSVNETAYIAGGFNPINAWKNYPVCPTCAEHLESGKVLVQNHFQHNFYGCNYYILPTPILNKNDFYKLIEDMKEEYHQISLRRKNAEKDEQTQQMEEEIFNCLAKYNDTATISFFFFKKDKKKFQILQEAEDIHPSRFNKIIQTKRKVENYSEFKNLKGLYKKEETQDLSFNFGIVRTFFHPRSKKLARPDFTNDFLDITTKILKNRPINKQFILHRISDHLAQGFRREELYCNVKKAMIFLKFLNELNLIKNDPLKLEVEMENQYEDYFQKHPDFYDADIKKALFLEGVLAQHVMDIQYRERNATPFRSRLNGLKIDQRIVKRILPEAINKLEQYKKNYYRELEEAISIYLESGEPDIGIMSVDEISFYFTMGMNLARQFKSKKEIEGGNDE